MTCRGCGERQLDRLQVAHFSHQNDVGIFAQCSPKRSGEGFRMHSDFPVIDKAVLAGVDKLDWVFHSDNVIPACFVGMIDDCSQSR